MTFSIVARCAQTGQLGIAIASAIPCTGAISAFVRRGAGALATQAWCNPYLGIEGLALLSEDLPAPNVLERILARDPQARRRQVGILDAKGGSAAHTGSGCTARAGHHVGDNYSVQGNMLADRAVLDEMSSAFVNTPDLDFADRLLCALIAGDGAGGDRRGKQSAAIVIHDRELFARVDIRVDDHPEPIGELVRIKARTMSELLPFVDEMPTELDWARGPSPAVVAMLSRSPQDRVAP